MSGDVHRIADVRLRGRVGSLRARAYWPHPAASGVAPTLLVLFPGGNAGIEAVCRHLCSRSPAVVLSAVDATSVPDAARMVEWAADHAEELGADPGRLILAGRGAGTELAGGVARYARDNHWPVITKVITVEDPADPP